MRNHKNNILFNARNITLILKNITPYFTGKVKIIALVFIIIMLSFTNIINTSALSYSSSVGVGFTFSPTLSVSISPSDLIISNLVPNNTLDSNVINVSVASNASYGYTLSVIVNGNNDDLTHSNGTNTFSSIATDADLADLEDSEDTNIWGYSYKNNTVEIPAWSNYNGLSSSNNATLLDTNANNTETGIDSIDFKIGAKAASTQTSGTYTGTINFTAVTKPTPMNLTESYFAAGKTRHNGYYAMQDMTSEICNNTEVIGEGSQTELIDLRDDKVYWATKLADGHCWMTQNLDLDLDNNRTYTHWDTDLGWTVMNEGAEWRPNTSTIDFSNGVAQDWTNSYSEPRSADTGDYIYYTSNSQNNDIQYGSLSECSKAKHNDCTHYYVGNYYNWPAAIANNNTYSMIDTSAPNSICPSNWELPKAQESPEAIFNFSELLSKYKITDTSALNSYTTDGFYLVRTSPLYFVRSGKFEIDKIDRPGIISQYWTSKTTDSNYHAVGLYFTSGIIYTQGSLGRNSNISVRCLAR